MVLTLAQYLSSQAQAKVSRPRIEAGGLDREAMEEDKSLSGHVGLRVSGFAWSVWGLVFRVKT